jgi:hypothetical protein
LPIAYARPVSADVIERKAVIYASPGLTGAESLWQQLGPALEAATLPPTLMAGLQPSVDLVAVQGSGRCDADQHWSLKYEYKDPGYDFWINEDNNPGPNTTARILDGFRTFDNTLDACHMKKRDDWHARNRYQGPTHTQINLHDDGKNVVGFSTGPTAAHDCRDEQTDADSPAVACAVSKYRKFTGTILESDIIYNLYYNWFSGLKVSRCSGAADVWGITVHEVGHTLGFDHVKDRRSVMWPYAEPCDDDSRLLSRGDVNAIREQY